MKGHSSSISVCTWLNSFFLHLYDFLYHVMKNSSLLLLCPLHAPQLGWCSLTIFICLGSVSCWNTHLCLFFKALNYLTQFWFNIPQYRTQFILSLNMWICSVPWDEKLFYTITLPSSWINLAWILCPNLMWVEAK